MKHKLTKWLHSPVGLLCLLLVGFVSWMAACTPTIAEAPASGERPYTFYLVPWAEDEDQRLVPMAPETLAAQPDARPLDPGILSADGSTRVEVVYPDGRNVNSPDVNPDDIWIVVHDLQSGVERSRFHPPASGLVSGLSEDGARLLLQPYPYAPPYPPRVEWYVVATGSGELLAHITDESNACFRQQAYFDPAGERIYCVVDPDLTEADGPQPMRIVAYDVDSGAKTAALELPSVLIRGAQRTENEQLVWHFLEPAVTLSPDGRQLAVVHADTDAITLVDARSLSVEKTFSLGRDTNLWDWFGFAPTTAHAKGEMEGTIRQAAFSADGQYLYVFTQELWIKAADAPAERGLWLVDLAREQIVAQALPDYQIQWIKPAPDGTVFAFGTTDENLGPYEVRPTSPSMLWRLHGRSLDVLAERPFTGYRGGRLVVWVPSQ